MPKYFVDFQDDSNFIEDEDGSDSICFKHVRDGAVEMLTLNARDKLRHGDKCKLVAIVRDEDGKALY